MTFIEVVGNVTEDGKLDAQLPAGTPVGKVSIIVVVEPELDDDDEALWEASFSKTQAALQEMATIVSAASRAGLTKPFDPNVDLDENGEHIT